MVPSQGQRKDRDYPAFYPAGTPPAVDPSQESDRTHERPSPPVEERGRRKGEKEREEGIA